VSLTDSISGTAFMELAGELIEKVEKRNKDHKPTVKLKVTK